VCGKSGQDDGRAAQLAFNRERELAWSRGGLTHSRWDFFYFLILFNLIY
jgi:hypothetical protein